ncbi:TPA: helix-turn-helix transcriptional regulator [Vibrio vulnificus]|nr:helix-turn-helix transcriptional regulator [Vibrio vulnificus]HDY7970067.1 helix-turn-helix transcriptional regulator [Vibrio vulnificus]
MKSDFSTLLDFTHFNISPIELEEIVLRELSLAGIENVVFMILDPYQVPQLQFDFGFSTQQLEIYQQHQGHDSFLQHYLRKGLIGQYLYMQEMLPVKQIRNPIFREVLIPTMQLHHSYCGLFRLVEHHYLMLSCHSFSTLQPKHRDHLDRLWWFLISWGNYWVAQQSMAKRLSQLNPVRTHIREGESLTDAELEVLSLLAQGMDGSEVARYRSVSKETVRSQIKRILHKTGCRHQNQLISRYYRIGSHSLAV